MKSDLALSFSLAPADQEYPRKLKQVFRHPPILYCRGNRSLLESEHLLSVVGSRHTTPVNQGNLDFVLGPVAQVSLTIISGLALGMDAHAHFIALRNGLPTIAVLGSSVHDREMYPRSNHSLAEKILSSDGLLISPFPPKTPIMPHNFPIRNQIIAALPQAVLIASAAKKSGALITARLALEYGNDVFVIPGNPFDPLYAGSNNLLQQGACPILLADDILEYFKLDTAPVQDDTDPTVARIVGELEKENLSLNQLAARLQLPVNSVTVIMSKLELSGRVVVSSDGSMHLVTREKKFDKSE